MWGSKDNAMSSAKRRRKAPARDKHYSLEAIFFMASEDLTAAGHDAESHVRTMRHYAVETMRELLGKRMKKRMVNAVARAILLHDFGKIFISERILQKKGKLSKGEQRAIRQHPQRAHILFNRTPLEIEAKVGILYHHERWDGRGYPRGLNGDAIPLIARMVAVVDAYEAMTHDRPYQEAVSRKKAIEELRRCSGLPFDRALVRKKRGELQFDAKVVEAFMRVHKRRHPEVY